jgi:hypothetical protein
MPPSSTHNANEPDDRRLSWPRTICDETYVGDLAGLESAQNIEQSGNQWLEILEAIAVCAEHHGSERASGQAVLIRQVLVHGHKRLADRLYVVQKRTIVDIRPTEITNGTNEMADDERAQRARDTVIQHDTHRPTR